MIESHRYYLASKIEQKTHSILKQDATEEETAMELPLQITFHKMEPSPEIEAIVREKAERLNKYSYHIMSCRVVIDSPHRHHHKGNQYQVRIDLKLAGSEIAINREPPEHSKDEDIRVALRDAFDSARRQVEDVVRHQRGFVKSHEAPPHARISKLFPQESYGFIETPDGQEIYFHRNSVVNDEFDNLEIGSEVSFASSAGEKGPQASTVKLVGRHGGR
jgi:cold shock CspA family protein/ribosome-associated translation inhibitor RaiA